MASVSYTHLDVYKRQALHRLSLVHEDRGDFQFVDIGTVVVLGVGDGGLDSLLQDDGGLLRREGEDLERTADQMCIRDRPHAAQACASDP